MTLIRGFARQRSPTIGNFWVDLTRDTLYVLIPICVLAALFLVEPGGDVGVFLAPPPATDRPVCNATNYGIDAGGRLTFANSGERVEEHYRGTLVTAP